MNDFQLLDVTQDLDAGNSTYDVARCSPSASLANDECLVRRHLEVVVWATSGIAAGSNPNSRCCTHNQVLRVEKSSISCVPCCEILGSERVKFDIGRVLLPC